jgi:hypothetical protein
MRQHLQLAIQEPSSEIQNSSTENDFAETSNSETDQSVASSSEAMRPRSTSSDPDEPRALLDTIRVLQTSLEVIFIIFTY